MTFQILRQEHFELRIFYVLKESYYALLRSLDLAGCFRGMFYYYYYYYYLFIYL